MILQTPRIIIAEDDKEVNSLITTVCRLNGYETFMVQRKKMSGADKRITRGRHCIYQRYNSRISLVIFVL